MNEHTRSFRDLSAEDFDTRTLLRNAAEQAIERHYEDFFIVDVDSHHYETEAFKEIAEFIEDPVLRNEAKFQGTSRGGISSETGSYQEIAGRITRYPERKNEKVPPKPHRDITLMERWMDQLGVDMAVMFPTPMLNLSNCPRHDVEVGLARGYNRWLCDTILDKEPRIKSMLYLPFHDPEACYKIVEEFGERKGVVGFMVTSTHYTRNYTNPYMKLYAALEERGLPLGFHAAFTWADQSLQLTNRFIAVHGLGFTWCNMLHLANWLVNGMPERFPKLKTIWIESGPRLGAVPDAAARQRIHDAHVRCAAAQAQAQRLHARDVLHLAADGDGGQQEGAGGHVRDDQRAVAASLLVRLSALGHGPAVDDLRPAVHRHAGQAQHPRRQRAEAVQAGAGAVASEAGAARGAEGSCGGGGGE